ncbi:adenylate cyclase type 10 [Caloenas nicobarica]|uniref:adenylate cyclase type 10 n=1 Tax=Caloenas nicobarica TaxID=187106 RepID=UPI0032B7BFC5
MAPQPGVLAFCDALQREVAYGLWPERQRVALHRKCAAFLEWYAHQCKSCSQEDFVPLHRFGVTSTQDGESCQGPTDLEDSGTWEALVLAGEQLHRNRTHITEGVLCTMLCSPGPPGGWGCVLEIGGSRSASDDPERGGQPQQPVLGVLGPLQGSLQAPWEWERNTYPGVRKEVSNTLFSFETLQMLCSSIKPPWRMILVVCLHLRYPVCHRALTMASLWEREYLHSNLKNMAAFLPGQQKAKYFFRRNLDIQSVFGVLLVVDISGFTALAEKLVHRSGTDRGTAELVETLNNYLADITDEMLVFGGDVLKFAGDAVLVLWSTTAEQVSKTLSLVLQCSQQIRKKYESRDTNVGQKLGLKIVVTAGPMSLLSVGDGSRHYLCVCGQAVHDIHEACELVKEGEVILSATSWELCEQHRFTTEHLANNRFVKAGAMSPVLFLPNFSDVEMLRTYIPAPALRMLEDRVPLALFSELRPVSCLFIHLKYAGHFTSVHFQEMLHTATRIILEVLHPHKGELNKLVLFDKGCTFLCVFGLTGEKLPHESIHALQSAIQIFQSCSTMLEDVQEVSVAVTSGTTFCGVTGHPERHEYTVLGQTVNLAARMMVNYPGLVSCDAATYAASRLPAYCFKELPEKKLKGFSQTCTVYEYVGITNKCIFGMGLTKKRSEYGPLLGREKEIEVFQSCLKAYQDFRERHVLVFEGSTGSGKSHLLTELAYIAQDAGQRVVAVELLEINVRQHYAALRTLMARALGLQDCEQCSDMEQRLETELQGTIEKSRYCLLNDLLTVQFPISNEIGKMNENERIEEQFATWEKVLEKILGGEFRIFLIDNAHFLDPASWILMSRVLQNIPVFMVMSLAPDYVGTEKLYKLAANTRLQTFTLLHLGELKLPAVVQKVCQALGVVGISRDLATFLMQRSLGNPYYCEELLRYLCCNDLLLFRTQRQGETAKEKWESLITSAVEASLLMSTSGSTAEKDGKVCIIRPDISLDTTVLPTTLKEIVLAQLDQLRPEEQMILKFAAVIGPVFTTQLLSHIVPAADRHKVNCLLDTLVSKNILKWLKMTEVPEDAQDHTEGPATSVQAEASVHSSSASIKIMAPQPGVLAFCDALQREVAYGLWPERQRVALHRKCAAFLEWYAHQCKSCSQEDFVPLHRFGVTSTQDGESCQGPTDLEDSGTWEALVLAGEQLHRNRTHITEDDSGAAGRFLAKSDQTTGLPSKTDGKHDGICSCECEAIVESVLVPLPHHYLAMGDASRAFYYLLECAAAYLHVSNNYMALMKLNEAEVLRKSLKDPKVIDRFDEATFFSLEGEVCCRMGHVKLAKKTIRKALSLLKRQFPRTSIGAFVTSQKEKLQWPAYAARRVSLLPQKARRKKLAWLLQQSCCLSLLDHLFSLEDTSSGRTFSHLAARMKANTQSTAVLYRAEDSHD